MLTTAELQTAIGQAAYGPDGNKLGKIGQVWVDDDSAQPAFVTVQTGLFGSHETFVPADDATSTGASVQMPFTKEQVKHAPQCEAAGGHITAEDGRRIYDYYGLPYAGPAAGWDDGETPPPDVAGTPWGTADPLANSSATGAPDLAAPDDDAEDRNPPAH